MIDVAAVAFGVAVGVCLAAAFRLHRRDAELLHALGELRDERERSARQEERIAALQAERRVAAENIVQLSGALLDATAQTQQTAVRVPPPVKIWLN